jgi:hypothetical protein
MFVKLQYGSDFEYTKNDFSKDLIVLVAFCIIFCITSP